MSRIAIPATIGAALPASQPLIQAVRKQLHIARNLRKVRCPPAGSLVLQQA